MSYLKQIDLAPDFRPFEFFATNFGFVPNLFRSQSLLPRVLDVEANLTDLLLVQNSKLSGLQKQKILFQVAAARRNTYCFTLHFETLRALGATEEQLQQISADHHHAGLSAPEVSLLDFVLKLSGDPLRLTNDDFASLRTAGFTDEQILEAEMCAAYEVFAATVATGLGVMPDFPPRRLPEAVPFLQNRTAQTSSKKVRPFLRSVEISGDFWPYAFFEKTLGFVPSYFRAQTLRPDLIESQARALEAVLLTSDVLSRVQKEFIFLVISAANLNTYCVANHCGVLRGLGIPDDKSDLIAFNHRNADLSPPDVALLDVALKLTQRPAEFSAQDINCLREIGFNDERILETIVLSGFANFINTMNLGLGVEPDFEPQHVFQSEHLSYRDNLSKLGEISSIQLNPFSDASRPIDEDEELIAKVCAGNLDAFEDLVRRHKNRVYRTLIAITGNTNDAEDYTQNVFLKAYKSLPNFARAAKFSTWLTRIAINEGIEQMRRRHPKAESLDSATVETDDFKPREVQAWIDDPERLYSRKEMRAIVENELMKLPVKYRVAVMLRDLDQLSSNETAAVLDISVEAVKSRLLRGRLLLREALTVKLRPGREDAARV